MGECDNIFGIGVHSRNRDSLGIGILWRSRRSRLFLIFWRRSVFAVVFGRPSFLLVSVNLKQRDSSTNHGVPSRPFLFLLEPLLGPADSFLELHQTFSARLITTTAQDSSDHRRASGNSDDDFARRLARRDQFQIKNDDPPRH